jgi:hypothetical protein
MQFEGRCKKSGKWIASGDFAAATDNIKIELTKLCLEAMINKILSEQTAFNHSTKEERELTVAAYRRVLYEHLIEYPNKEANLEPVAQVNGQLMGSNLSFPILCIINLVTYWLSVEPQIVDFRDLNVLVNGDDIMFKCYPKQYTNWMETLHEAGLSPSAGKNFFHWKYGTVNSALFYQEKDRCHYVPFFNAGMLLGQSKVAKTAEGRHKPIHCLHQSVMHGALNKIRADARFRFYNQEALKRCSTTPDGVVLNWYFPATMGGLGMQLPDGVRFTRAAPSCEAERGVTRQQLALAYGLRKAWYADDLQRPPMKPIGQQVDTSLEGGSCVDIRKRQILVAQLASCPMMPYAEPLREERHPANWYIPQISDTETQVLQYQFQGLSYKKFAKPISVVADDESKGCKCEADSDCHCDVIPAPDQLRDNKKFIERRSNGDLVEYPLLDVDNPHLYEPIVLYRRRADRRGLMYVESQEEKEEKRLSAWCQQLIDEYANMLQEDW